MGKKIAIVGGAGFIGSHLVNLYGNTDAKVHVFDNFSTGNLKFIEANTNMTIHKGDILNFEEISKFVDDVKPDVLFHLAAIHFIPQCEENPTEAIRINIEGTQNVLTACSEKVSRVIFTSTGAIYSPEIETSLSENAEIDTRDVYGMTKFAAEKLVEHHERKGRGETVIARLFNAVGTNETNPHLIPAILDQLEEGKTDVELGNLYPKRDYIHVDDIAAGLKSLADCNSFKKEKIFNIGSGTERSIQELIDIFREVTKLDIKVIQVKSRMRKNDRKSQLADISQLTNQTNWKPERDVNLAISQIWEELKISNS